MTENKTAATNKNESFADLLNASMPAAITIKVGEVTEGKVISIGKENIFLDLGARAEGMLAREECMIDGRLTVKEDDSVQVLVSAFREGIFHCTSRLRQTGASESRQNRESPSRLLLQEAFNKGLPVEGKVKSLQKGGFEVHVLGQKAFCPISQIEKNYCQNPEIHLDKTYTFLVMQYEEDGRNIVVGRKELLQSAERERSRQRWLELQAGQVHEGTVISVHDYGAFVDIGGVEGLLHVSEISHQKTPSAQAALSVGQKLNVVIIKLDQETRKISLSLKALQADPWVAAGETVAVGKEFPGVVLRLKPFGAFVELFPGVVGLLHISQLGADRRVAHPKEILAIGQTVNVRVLAVDLAKKTISLTMEEAAVDYGNELVRLKKKQEEDLNAKAGTMAALLDSAIVGKDVSTS
ncbi:MAG: S1 RNA-binding domain-containing protein [Candidatus Aminicenantes bacterium]|nr:S1 RNA-binding domain-containing protein [Candidatus Aminicenantes bacterium]